MTIENSGCLLYNLFKPIDPIENGTSIILYHGWGTDVESYSDVAEKLAENGYTVIVPEIIHHDTRMPLANHFKQEIMWEYFWKTIYQSINEASELIDHLNIAKQKIIVAGSSMGGFIANGIFADQKGLGGLVNINGSGSFLVSEKIFRSIDGRDGIPAEEVSMLQRYDPVGRENCNAPVLLLHGDSDKIVPLEGQEDYFRYLTKDEGRQDVEFFTYKGINHQFSPEMLKDMITWLHKIS